MQDIQAQEGGARDIQAQKGGAWDMQMREGDGMGVPLREPIWKGGHPRVLFGVPTREGWAQAGKEGYLPKGAPDGHVHLPAQTVHQVWHAYLIAHPQHRGPHRCDGIYLLQRRCSKWLVQIH